MADLAASGVSVTRVSSETLSNGITLFTKACVVTIAVMGTSTNKILATAFGLSAFEESSSFSKTDNLEILVPGISSDRSYLLLKGVAVNTPLDYSGTYNVYVKGY